MAAAAAADPIELQMGDRLKFRISRYKRAVILLRQRSRECIYVRNREPAFQGGGIPDIAGCGNHVPTNQGHESSRSRSCFLKAAKDVISRSAPAPRSLFQAGSFESTISRPRSSSVSLVPADRFSTSR